MADLKFKKPKPNRIYQHVVDQIQGAILDGSLKAGDMLPSEMKLKEMFETSRGTIREALRVLEQKGLIDIKIGVGGGAVVKAVGTEKIVEGLDLLIQTKKVTYDHLAEFREGVEGLVASLAAERVKEKDIKRLRGLLSEAEKILNREPLDSAAFVRLDMDLHIALAEIVGNPIYLANLRMIHERILGRYEQFSLRSKRVLAENLEDLKKIVAAVETGKGEEARNLVKQHVRKFNRHMKEEHKPA
ncbi:MAG: FadR family transcriptional regulator [Deltaproteobacteria bacterium]|nr:FadR family transcriptional regulator [Deltaproteobacteria bacterium]MBW2015930.1 FadR family transcriptional regulator [Deltaproteobacteria bacterium]MBW2127956.1 FadR family transcriptional regulator [Deltaproteobacteria bacterium]MBW2303220.1 FadR family transcriptional regulator [Deltaproteobacteria bacterium]